MGRFLISLVREHRALMVLLVLAVALRVAVAIAFRPALFFGDSYEYLQLATEDPLGISAKRPSGYPLLLKVFSLDGRSVGAVTAVQHLAGLVTGVLVYAMLLRLGVRRWAAAVAAGVVLLDGYAIALEQFVLSEAFFTLALTAACFLAIGERRGPVALGASGLLLAAGVLMRPAAIFALPFWAAYLLLRRFERRALAVGALALVLPLFAYASIFEMKSGEFGITQADGWFLYARVAEMADCRGVRLEREARPLCERSPGAGGRRVGYYLWDSRSPARRLFGQIHEPGSRQRRTNDVLKGFAIDIIAAHPTRYAEMVADDVLRYFQPGVMSVGNSDEGLKLALPVSGQPLAPGQRGSNTTPARPGTLAYQLRRYQDLIHTPRWLLGPLAIAALLAVVLAAFRRNRAVMAHGREVMLLAGAGLAMLVGSVATSEFIVRYLIPFVPLLISGGILALTDLARLAVQRSGNPRSVARRA